LETWLEPNAINWSVTADLDTAEYNLTADLHLENNVWQQFLIRSACWALCPCC
jgi:hypothetical protein